MSAVPEPLLPEEVRDALGSGELSAAGELLRSHAETLARSRPGRGLAWGDALLGASGSWPELAPWVDWSVATVRYLCGEADRAEPLLVTAARAFRARGRGDLSDRIGLIQLDLYAERLELGKARRLAARLVERFSAAGDRRRLASALANLANAEDAADRIETAARLWRRALREVEADDPRALLFLGNLGNVAAIKGRFEEALQAHRNISEAATRQGMEALAIQAELNLADTELSLGDVDIALQRWHDAAQRAEQAALPLLEAVTQVELARAELDLGQSESARRRLVAAVDRLEQLGLVLEQARAWRLLAVSDAVSTTSDPRLRERARRFLQRRGLAAQRDLLEVDLALLDPATDPAVVRAAARRLLKRGVRQRGLLGLAWAAAGYADRGDHRSALRLAREVLAGRRLSPWISMTAHHVSALCSPAGSPAGSGGPAGSAEALRHAREAVRCADRVRGRLRAAADRNAFLRARGEIYVDLIWRLVHRHRPGDLRQCLELLSTLKAGWLVEELAQRADRGDDDLLVRRWQALRHRLAALVSLREGEDEPRIRRIGVQVDQELRRLETQLTDLETDLHRVRPGLLPECERTSRQLPELLPHGHAFVELLVDRNDILGIVVWQGRLTVHRLPGAAAEVRSLAESVCFHQDAHTCMSERHAAARERSVRHRLRQLGRLLLAALPEGWSCLWVAPHDVLYSLPWLALIDDRGRALVDRGIVTMVPSARIAAALLAVDHRRPGSFALVGAGSGSLPLVEPEIRQLAAGMTGATTYLAATRQDLLHALAHHQAVHLAGHAVYLDDAPGASGLRLEDGFVTIHDLAVARIHAGLVSFGVCSGVRLQETEAFRFEGFLRVLLSAGVRNVVGPTGWVRDESAHRFALAFYASLQRSAHPAAAFRDAVRALRSDDPNPAAWGFYQIYGDARQWSMP